MDYGINLYHRAWCESFYSDNIYNKVEAENLINMFGLQDMEGFC